MCTHLIVGCGYLGERVARRWVADGVSTAAVTRRSDRAGQLAEIGVVPVVADMTQPERLSGLPEAETVLFAVGFDRSGDGSIHDVYVKWSGQLVGRVARGAAAIYLHQFHGSLRGECRRSDR